MKYILENKDEILSWTSVVLQLIFIVLGGVWLLGTVGLFVTLVLVAVLLITTWADISLFIEKHDWDDEE